VIEKASLGRLYNLGPKDPVSIRSLVEITARRVGVPFEQLCTIVPDRPGQDLCYWLDSSVLKKETGWDLTIDLETGIDSMIEWGRKYLPQIQNLSDRYQFQA